LILPLALTKNSFNYQYCIGKGGFGKVWKVERKKSKQPYAMKEMSNYKKAIIVSGDGDFFSLAEYLDQKGRLAAILTPNWQYSSLLKPFENKIIRLDQMRSQLAYHDHKKKTRQK
jgi:serine/threonine protein kinase